MSTTRLLLDTLETTFKNPKTKEKLCFSARSSFERGLGGTRVFDDFPQLLPETTMLSLKESFRDLFLIITEADENYELIYATDKKAIEACVKKIINMGISELLARDGNIKKEIRELLGWKDINVKPAEVVAAFVAAIHAHIISNQTFEAYPPRVKTAIFNYVNKYENWIDEELKAHKNHTISTYDFIKRSAPTFLFGTIAVAGTAYILYNQFTSSSEAKSETLSQNFKHQ